MFYASYVLSFVEGILTFISPCILPLLPVYFSYLAGSGEKEERATGAGKGRLLLNSIGFVAGFTAVFVVLGATATSMGHFLKSNIDIFRKASGMIMVVFGLNFMGVLRIDFLNKEKRLEYNFKHLTFLRSIVFGMVFGFGWTPCLGAFLGSALLMAGNSQTITQGIAMLLAYSTGLGIPFILTAVIFDRIKSTFRQIQKHNRIISIVSGILLILAGILVYADKLKYLAYFS